MVYGSYVMKTVMQDILKGSKFSVEYVGYEDSYDPETIVELEPRVVIFAFSKLGEMEAEDIGELLRDNKRLLVMVICLNATHTLEQNLISSGVRGLISQEEDFKFIPAAIVALEKGELWCPRSILQQVLESYRLHSRRGQPDSESESALTKREIEVLRLIAKSYKNKEIAEELGVSYSTVVSHIYNIYRKLDVTSRVQAIQYAITHRLIELIQ